MPTSGDVVRVDLGTPLGSESGMVRPVVIITAQRVLGHSPRVLQVVPLTTTIRGWTSEVTIPADSQAGLGTLSAAQCQHIRAIAAERVIGEIGNVGAVVLHQIRETLATLLDQ